MSRKGAWRGRAAGRGKTRSQSTPQRGPFEHAVNALEEVLRFAAPADAVLARYFREHRELGQRDRAFVAENVFAVLRRLRGLGSLAGASASARELLLLCLSGQEEEADLLASIASADELAWLESLKNSPPTEQSLAERVDWPDWLLERLQPEFDEAGLLALAQALNRPAPLDLRVNIARSGREAVLAALRADGLEVQPCRLSPHGLRLEGKPALQQHPLFLSGEIEVQDEGSQLLAFLVQPRRGELVVDFCAGAGGKTLHLGAMMRSSGRLYAFDVSERRLSRLRPRAERAGLTNVHPALIAHERDARVKRLHGKADRVLVDVPCSGLGTLRRSPDLKWRQTPATVAEMRALQASILDAAAALLRPGGRLVYATCSLLREENEDIVEAFAAANPQFREVDAGELLRKQGVEIDAGPCLRLWPHQHGTDGFFAAVFERVEDA